MNAWIPIMFVALVCALIHFLEVKLDKKYRARAMESITTTGLITKFYQEDNQINYYVKFTVDGKEIEKQAFGSYSLDTSYDVGYSVSVAYHVSSKGYVTAFIQDEMFDELKNKKTGKLFLICAVIFMLISIGLFGVSRFGMR